MTILTPKATTQHATGRKVDGVICVGGEDWWYHNRGHYDMQMMREFSRICPVLYINSIGMRVPSISEGSMFFSRVSRKLKSLRRGLVPVRENFSVLSVLAAPGKVGRSVQKVIMPRQVKSAAQSMGITQPLVWVACPPGELILDSLNPVGTVYQRTDRFEAFPGVNAQEICQMDEKLRSRADLVLYCSRSLFNEESENCQRAAFVDHGVDFDRFSAAGDDPNTEPDDIKSIPHPRVGFVGSIDAHTFDPELFKQIVHLLPDMHFVMVGGSSLPEDWCTASNVHFLGQKDYSEVADYMAWCDVLIMPWNNTDWIKACNPVKLKEYLATGRPVVSTPYDELKSWKGYVRVAQGGDEFAAQIRSALDSECDREALRDRVRQETWAAKADEVRIALSDLGINW